MKLLIASDIHGSFRYCEKLMHAYDREQAERMLLLGDILYHGPRNDLPEQYAPKKVIEALNERKNDILCVRGNCVPVYTIPKTHSSFSNAKAEMKRNLQIRPGSI